MPRVHPLSPKIRRRAPLAVLPAALLGAMAVAVPAMADPENQTLDFNTPGAIATIGDTGFDTALGGAGAFEPGKLTLDGSGTLNVTSGPGTPENGQQKNALLATAGARTDSYYVEADIKPIGKPDFAQLLTEGHQETGIVVGTALNNYVKIVAQAGGGTPMQPAAPRIEFLKSGTAGRRQTPSLVGVTCIRVTLRVNNVSKVVLGAYDLGCDNAGTVGMGYFPLTGIGSAGIGGGIITSNADSPNPITAGYDNFTVGAYTADGTAPQLVAQSPGPNTTGVPTTTTIQATFADQSKMDLSTINNTTFQLTKTATGEVVQAGPISGDNSLPQPVFTLTPDAPLDPGTPYTVTLNGVYDGSGNALPLTTWSFTTAAAAAPPAPPAPPAGGGTGPSGTGGSTGTGGTGGIVPPPLLANSNTGNTALKASFSVTKRVKAGKKAKITLKFNQAPNGSQIVVQRKNGKKFLAIFRSKATKSTTILQFPVGKKLGKFTFRASYKDGGATKLTAPFSLTVIK